MEDEVLCKVLNTLDQFVSSLFCHQVLEGRERVLVLAATSYIRHTVTIIDRLCVIHLQCGCFRDLIEQYIYLLRQMLSLTCKCVPVRHQAVEMVRLLIISSPMYRRKLLESFRMFHELEVLRLTTQCARKWYLYICLFLLYLLVTLYTDRLIPISVCFQKKPML